MLFRKIGFRKLLFATVFAFVIFASLSICVNAAQIDKISCDGSILYAKISGDNVATYVAQYENSSLLSLERCDIGSSGCLELSATTEGDRSIYLWDRDSLAPLSSPYIVRDGKIYSEFGNILCPIFDESADVVIVESVSGSLITGYQGGVLKQFPLSDGVSVFGLANSFSDIVPGSVVLMSVPYDDKYIGVELLATMGIPLSGETFSNSFGTYTSGGYSTVLGLFSSKNGKNLGLIDFSGTPAVLYKFASYADKYYRVGIAVGEDDVDVAIRSSAISSGALFENAVSYYNYVLLRVNNTTGYITDAVVYCVPRNYNPGAGDGEYTDIFSFEELTQIY